MRIFAAAAFLALCKGSLGFLVRNNHGFHETSATLRMAKRVLVPIADGSEEIETTCITDTLTRFGADVTTASVMPEGQLVCKMSRGIKIVADMSIEDAAKEDFDLVVCPGGMPGAEHMRDSKSLVSILKKQKAAGKRYAAICAAPAVILASNGLLEEAGATCYPAQQFREKLENPVDDEVAVTGMVTTSQGPGTSFTFALELGQQLFGKEARDKIQKEMLL